MSNTNSADKQNTVSSSEIADKKLNTRINIYSGDKNYTNSLLNISNAQSKNINIEKNENKSNINTNKNSYYPDSTTSNSQINNFSNEFNKQTFKKENIIESANIDVNKDYFEFESEKDKKYDFMDIRNFFYSKQMLKAFLWSIGIGSSFFAHRYLRTRSWRNGMRWGSATMITSFLFLWGNFEMQFSSANYVYTKQLEKQAKKNLNNIIYRLYQEKLREKKQSTNNGMLVNNNNNEIQLSTNIANNNFMKSIQMLKYLDPSKINSDLYARLFLYFLKEEVNVYNSLYDDNIHYTKDNSKNNSDNTADIDEESQPIDFNSFIKVKLRYNPFKNDLENKNIEFELDEELGIEEEEEFYLNEINKEADFFKDYQIMAVWFDYDKLSKTGLNTTVLSSQEEYNKLLSQYKIILSSEEEYLASLESDFKLSLNNNILNKKSSDTSNHDNIFFPKISNEDYLRTAISNAEDILNSSNNINDSIEKQISKNCFNTLIKNDLEEIILNKQKERKANILLKNIYGV